MSEENETSGGILVSGAGAKIENSEDNSKSYVLSLVPSLFSVSVAVVFIAMMHYGASCQCAGFNVIGIRSSR